MDKVPFFLGHHKSGTRYIGKIMETFCQNVGMPYLPINNPKWFGFDLSARIPLVPTPFVNYMNADYEYIRAFPAYRAFHVIRDPRDLGISAYFSHRYSHSTDWWPELVAHRARLETLSFECGLLEDLSFTDALPTDGFPITVFSAMDQWNYDDPDIMELKFEQLIAKPLETLISAFAHVGLLDSDKTNRLPILTEIVEDNRFEKLSGGRAIGEENERHHYRGGQPNEWRRRLGEVHKNWFRQNYPRLLIRTGYETNEAW